MKKRFLLATLIIGFISSAKADLKKGLLLYEPMDGSLAPAYCAGAEKTTAVDKCKFVKGRVKQAVAVQSKPVGMLYNQGNLNYPVGTLAFWYQADYEPGTSKKVRRLFRCGNLALTWVPGNKKLFFMTAEVNPPKGFEWGYSTFSQAPHSWKKGEWHHIAISWDAPAKKKQLYIDGKLVADVATSRIENTQLTNKVIGLGGSNADGAYDELMVWDRVLSADEIAQVVAVPDKVASELRTKKQETAIHRSPVRVNLKQLKNPVDSILEPGATYAPAFELENVSGKPFNDSITLKLEDVKGKVFAENTLEVKLEPGAKQVFTSTFQLPNRKGSFKVGMYHGDYIQDVAVCAVWPKEVKVHKDSFFANHVKGFTDRYLKQAARLGLGWQRVHDMLQFTWWKRVQPEPGKFTWNLDSIWKNTKKYEMPVLGCLTGTPYWAVKGGPAKKKGGPRGYAVMPDMALWRQYVKETVNHYKRDISHWEIYNEPAVPGFWRGTPEELVQVTTAACEEARKADPKVTLMASGFTYSSWRYHEACAKAGLLKPLDIISYHYCPTMDEPEVAYKKYEDVVNHFQRLWKKYGPANKPLRLWSTESSIPSTTWFRGLEAPELPEMKFRQPMNNLKACKRIIQGVVIMQNLGVEKHFYYWFGPLPLGKRSAENTSMLDVTGAPRPKQMVRVAMAEQIDGTNFKELVKRDEGRIWAAVYQNKSNPKQSVVVWWCGTGGKLSMDLNWQAKAKAYDMMGNAIAMDSAPVLTDEPCFVQINDSAANIISDLKQAPVKLLNAPAQLEIVDDENKPDVPSLPDYVAPAENRSSIFYVDLKPYCNMNFADDEAGNGKGGWADEGPMNDMRDMTVGGKEYYGVPFKIVDPKKNDGKSIITLRGKMVTPTFPDCVDIKVNKKNVRCLYFLHSASYGSDGNIGSYRINYDDGTSEVIQNIIPHNNENWWDGYNEKEISNPVPIRVTSTLSGKPSWRYLRVFEWVNPSRNKTIASIEARSTTNKATPILVAITGCE